MIKKRILFVCHGNICRSPMAEFVMKDRVRQAGVEKYFHIESAATSMEELGNEVYPPVRRILMKHGLNCDGKYARRVRQEEYGSWDLFIIMDRRNKINLERIFSADPGNKIHLLLDYTDRKGSEVADPWYSGDFSATWNDVNEGCQALLDSLLDSLPDA